MAFACSPHVSVGFFQKNKCRHSCPIDTHPLGCTNFLTFEQWSQARVYREVLSGRASGTLSSRKYSLHHNTLYNLLTRWCTQQELPHMGYLLLLHHLVVQTGNASINVINKWTQICLLFVCLFYMNKVFKCRCVKY